MSKKKWSYLVDTVKADANNTLEDYLNRKGGSGWELVAIQKTVEVWVVEDNGSHVRTHYELTMKRERSA